MLGTTVLIQASHLSAVLAVLASIVLEAMLLAARVRSTRTPQMWRPRSASSVLRDQCRRPDRARVSVLVDLRHLEVRHLLHVSSVLLEVLLCQVTRLVASAMPELTHQQALHHAHSAEALTVRPLPGAQRARA